MERRKIALLVLMAAMVAQTIASDWNIFSQKVDHFGFEIYDEFNQRYHFNGDYYRDAGDPIYFVIGGEENIDVVKNNTGFFSNYPSSDNPSGIVYAEHRYYGESYPPTDPGRKYLTTEQALADFAALISFIREEYGSSHPPAVYTVGYGYGGMLAAWMRMKFPHLVAGAIASSAPINMYINMSDPYNFLGIVSDVFGTPSSECGHYVHQGWAAIRAATTVHLTKTFHLCQTLATVDQLIDYLSETYVTMAQYDYPYDYVFAKNPVGTFCSRAVYYASLKPSASVLEIIDYGLDHVAFNESGTGTCLNITKKTKSEQDLLSWSYQQCTEHVFPISSGKNDIFEEFTWDAQVYSDQCHAKFGIRPDFDKIPITFGGEGLKYGVSNIVFANGNLDPWSAGGIGKDISPTVKGRLIMNGAHLLDMQAPNSADPSGVSEVRDLYKSQISEWHAIFGGQRYEYVFFINFYLFMFAFVFFVVLMFWVVVVTASGVARILFVKSFGGKKEEESNENLVLNAAYGSEDSV